MIKDISKIKTWHIWKVTYLCRNVTIVCGGSYHLLGSWISWDLKIRFCLQVEFYISDWRLSESQHIAWYVPATMPWPMTPPPYPTAPPVVSVNNDNNLSVTHHHVLPFLDFQKNLFKSHLSICLLLTLSGRLATAERHQVMVGIDDHLCVCLQEVSIGQWPAIGQQKGRRQWVDYWSVGVVGAVGLPERTAGDRWQ